MDTLNIRTQPVWAYLQLMRPANIVTAWADILVGCSAALGIGLITGALPNAVNLSAIGWLILATSGLYGGGITFNDVFDYQLDQEERPERPLPSGKVTPLQAGLFGGLQLILGILAALQVSMISAAVATFVAIAALLYNAVGKHNTWLGPINMGFCRGGNLMLGVSVVPAMLTQRWMIAILPIVYIAAITAISRGEVEGGKTSTGQLAIALVISVMLGVFSLVWLDSFDWQFMLPFILFLGGWVFPAFFKATYEPIASNIGKAVRAGVLGLIILDAAIASGFAGWFYGLLVLSLLPLSMGLARLFSVT